MRSPLSPWREVDARPYVVVAAEVDGVRLIDNMPLKA